LLVSCSCIAQDDCRVYDLQIGTARDIILSELKHRGCKLKIEAPEGGLEDDLVLPSNGDKYSHHEVIFGKGKLLSVWSYSPYFSSAERAFSRLFEELAKHSTPDNPGKKTYDTLGQRSVGATVFLQRPIAEDLGGDVVGFSVENGTVILRMKKTRDGAIEVRVEAARVQ